MSLVTVEIWQGPRRLRELSITKPIVGIGRGSQCDIRVDGDSVSSLHARMRIYSTHAVVEDAGSLNGVFVDGQRASGPVEVGQGSIVQLGPGGPSIHIINGLPPVASSGAAAVTHGSNRVAMEPAVTHGSRNSLYWLVGILTGLVFLGSCASIIVVGTLFAVSPPKAIISSIRDSERLSQAVGLVINGAEVPTEPSQCLWLGTGTGFTVSEDGYVATNKHVIKEKSEILSLLRERLNPGVRQKYWIAFGGKIYPAELVHVSSQHDFAMLKVDRQNCPHFNLSLAQNPELLTEVYAAGFPGAARISLTSEEDMQDWVKKENKELELHVDIKSFFRPRDFQVSLTKGVISKIIAEGEVWFQHDTMISHGNSGGPLCLADGTVVGINTRANPDDPGNSFSLAPFQLREEIDAVTKNVRWSR